MGRCGACLRGFVGVATVTVCCLLDVAAPSAADREPVTRRSATADTPGASAGPARPLDFAPFADALSELDAERLAELEAMAVDAGIVGLRARLAAGETSARELVLLYLSRIRRFDGELGAVLELNPEALVEADRLDASRANGGGDGRLHGVPILVKGNVATGDELHTSAGALALADHVAPRDAFVVARLREAGALILGTTNLSEWAHYLSTDAPSGYSALGGQTVNPFGAKLAVLGSSTGSAVAAAARLAAATLGTETTGSIVAPAAANGVAGMRPTLGLVSADLIVPITAELDGAGPIGRRVADLAELLTVMAVRDDADPNVALADGLHGTDFTDGLEGHALDGLTIGVPALALPAGDDPAAAVLGRTVALLVARGARVVPVPMPVRHVVSLVDGHPELLAGNLRVELGAWLDATDAPLASLADVVAFNARDPDVRAPFGQGLLRRALEATTTPAEHAALATRLRRDARAALRAAAAGPPGEPADVLLSLDNTLSLFYAVAGTPAVTVPAGRDAAGQPRGATFVGVEPGSDARVLGIARAFERATDLLEEPPLEP